MSDEVLEKWRDRAQAIRTPRTNFGLPTHAFLGEAVDVTAFARNYWSTEYDGQGKLVRPGLESVNTKETRLDPKRVDELDELQQAAHRAQFKYKMAVNTGSDDIMERAGATLAELTAILEYYYDDGEDTVEDVQLERLNDQHTQPTSPRTAWQTDQDRNKNHLPIHNYSAKGHRTIFRPILDSRNSSSLCPICAARKHHVFMPEATRSTRRRRQSGRAATPRALRPGSS